MAQRGSVAELNSKRLLALNLRKLGGEELLFTPRSYVLAWGDDEFESFVSDFKVSQAFAVLKYVSRSPQMEREQCRCSPHFQKGLGPETERPEGLLGREAPKVIWQSGPDQTQPVTDLCVNAALAVARRVLEVFRQGGLGSGGSFASVTVNEGEWALLRAFHPDAHPRDTGLASFAAEAEELLSALPLELQITSLQANYWALKPSLNGGGNGRGILLMDRLPESSWQLLDWAAAVGRGGARGTQDAMDGCVLQKLVEDPHLLDLRRLQDQASQLGDQSGVGPHACDGISGGLQDEASCVRESCFAEGVADSVANSVGGSVVNDIATGASLGEALAAVPRCTTGMYKYNFRLWVLANMASPPSVWLYRDSYVDLAAQEFTVALSIASHVTNLRRGQRTFQRYWPIANYAAYLQATCGGEDLYHAHILPQARAIVCGVFRALLAAPSSIPDTASTHLKRLGIDLLVDARHHVWLVEINVLRGGAKQYGLKAAKGQETKDVLAERLVEEEIKLKTALRKGGTIPDTWEDLSGSIACGAAYER
mmetsp:Transcript_39005/g.107400  ORF Transcript_39005/g.107400 Transcript_39005/m.107400 type:complete len:539 (-) Transcript_39005:177-1793(-)